jgi:hypothetical protein
MASETATSPATESTSTLGDWKAGLVGGLVGSAVFGAMMLLMNPGVIAGAIPSMYGIEPPNAVAGFAIHLGHGAVLGVVFAATVGAVGAAGASARKLVATGLVYGVVVWAVLAVFVMPVWLQGVGFPPAPEVPNVGVGSLVGHAVYGVLLGAVYHALEGL